MKSKTHKKRTVPGYWTGLPDWFIGNDWLIENQEHLFVRRLGNTISQINQDKNIISDQEKPMQATMNCLMGDIASSGTKFQYQETLKELNALTGNDRVEANKIMEEFKKNFEEYLPFLS